MKRYIPLIVAALLLISIVPFHILAEETFAVDTTLMAEGSKGAYSGDKDAAFEISGDTIKLHFNFYTGESPLRVTTEYGGCNTTAAAWFNNANFRNRGTLVLNGAELTKDATAQPSYFTITRTAAATPADPVVMEIVIKPGVEITTDFFSKNQLVLNQVDKSGNIVDTITIGTNEEPEEEYTFNIDRTLMAEGSKGAYSGDKDAAFEISGDTIKLHFTFYIGESPLRVTTEYGGCNTTAAAWFNNANFRNRGTLVLNGAELTKDATAQPSYFTITRTAAATPADPVVMEIVIKPGVEITTDFFSKNQLVLNQVDKSGNIVDTVKVGKSTSPVPDPEPEPENKAAKTITAAEDYRVPTEANQNNNLQLKITNDYDKDWASKLTQVTYSYGEGTPVAMVLGSGSIVYPYSGDPIMFVDSGEIAAKDDAKGSIFIGVRYSFFQNQNIPKGETREYTFTFKADGYEDSVVKQTVRNPKEVLEVAVNKGAKYSFALEDLQKMWKDEGSKEYTYSVYDTIPDVLEQEKHYGPTLKTVLAAAKIDLDSLADNDVIELSTASNTSLGYKARITVKDLKEKRYAFPNGASPNKFKGTTAEQLEGKTEVPYIISLRGGENDLRNIFGQRDPQEEQKYDWVQYLGKITVYKGTATVYDGLTPSIESGSKVKEGDKLNFDFSTTGWQAGTASYAGIYYTVSTDGTEPADPTFSDIFYNYRQYGNPSYKDHPEYFNTYEFTNAEKTIIKAMIYIRGYAEPKVMTLTYTHDHVAAAAVKENEKAATCTEPGSYEEVVYCSECGAEISRETKTVEALGHTEVAIGEAKAATCTEAGMTAGKKCSVCGETLEEQKELPALGHDWKVIPEVISTCTKKGSTAGVRCTRCGEYMLEPHEVPMIYHDYQNGKCTVCGAEDPDYKPDEPTPIEPDTKFTGLANEADKDGVWWYYTDGKIDKTHTGVDQNKYGWWRVENGKVNFNAQSIYQNQYGWWKTTDGEVTFKENSIYQNEYGWWKCKNSKVDFNAQSIYQNKYGWWKTTNGKVTFKEQGVYQNNYGWWKCKDSKVDFNANGKVTYNGKTYNVKNGKATLS